MFFDKHEEHSFADIVVKGVFENNIIIVNFLRQTISNLYQYFYAQDFLCDRCSLYAHNPHLVCAVHPSGVETDKCLDFRPDSNVKIQEQWSPEGAARSRKRR